MEFIAFLIFTVLVYSITKLLLLEKNNDDDKNFDNNNSINKDFISKIKQEEVKTDNGENIILYSNGKIKEIYFKENGVKKGPVKEYFKDGKLKLEGNYFQNKDKEVDGLFVRYYYNDDGTFITREIPVEVYMSLEMNYMKFLGEIKKIDINKLTEDDFFEYNIKTVKELKEFELFLIDLLDRKNEGSILRVHHDELEELHNIYYFQGQPFTGVYYGLYPNGNLLLEAETLNGITHGTCKNYKVDGTIYTNVIYNNGKIHDDDIDKQTEFVRYMSNEFRLQNEILNEKSENLKDKPNRLPDDIKTENGENIIYYANGNIEEKYIKINGELDGIYKSFYENGQLRSEIKYSKGVEDGKSYEYFENGQISKVYSFKLGTKNGQFVSYFENGQIHFEYNFLNDLEDGIQKNWYENGQLDIEKNMKNGLENGLIRQFFVNGQIELEREYNNGEPIGIHKQWNEEGELINEINYSS